VSLEEDLHILEVKLKQLKLDYEQYFCGNRPREPVQARGEVQKQVLQYANNPIKNTALRFKFNSIQSRFQAYKRQWDNVTRQIEAGTYKRHVFKANMRERDRARQEDRMKSAEARGEGRGDRRGELFDAYREAARSCGQDVSKISPERLDAVIRKQEAQLKRRLGCDRVDFRVVVQDGKVKLKASPGR